MQATYDPDSGEQITETLEDSLSVIRAEIHALVTVLIDGGMTTAQDFHSTAAALLSKIDQAKERKRQMFNAVHPVSALPNGPRGVYIGNADLQGKSFRWRQS